MELIRSVAGVGLDPWQELVLRGSLGERADGKWSAFEVGLCCPRQNGKNEILVARQLVGLFLLGERLIIHSAHEFATSLEAFERLKEIVENTPAFHKRLAKNGIKNSHGEEGIKLKSGQRIRFRTRTKGGGRGFTCDCLILDEAMEIQEKAHGALLPTLSARPNPQVWYTGSAVDQWVHDNGVVFARVRERGIEGKEPGLAYFEWSPDIDGPEDVAEAATDPEVWAQANPALGIRISPEHVAREQRSMDGRTFAVERLNVGDWPRTDDEVDAVIGPETWRALTDLKSKPQDPVCFAFDCSPDRSTSAIAVAGLNAAGRRHVEVVQRGSGTRWVVDRLADLVQRHRSDQVICDGGGPASSLLAQLGALGIEVTVLTAKEYAQACGEFFDGCEEGTLCHLGQEELTTALRGAAQRSLGDAWAWSRKSSSADISPLVAATLALRGVSLREAEPAPVPLVNWI